MTSTPLASPTATPATAQPDESAGSWPARFLRGRLDDPGWVRPALLGLLVTTGALYIWGLGRSGWANAFYSAAAQAGSVSWKAMFYASSDAANSITVDKTPAALWLMTLSCRIFGVNSWSILVPEALEGVATVGLLYLTVRRVHGPVAGLLAGACTALTPVAVLMFRFNNPDALLVLTAVASAYALVRALERGSTRWLVAAGVFVGAGFLAKMLQALLIVPVLAVVYLVAGPPKLAKRIGQLLLSGLAMVLAAGWYIAIVELVPASRRPYIGGSQHNSLLELALGYNGLGRLNGEETGSVGGGPGRGWGSTGIGRMFDDAQGGQISWLLPAALILLVAGLVVTAKAARTDRVRASWLLWGGWLLVTGGVFSFMRGIFHPYYTVALAPAVGALVGMGASTLWRLRGDIAARCTMAGAVGATAWWAWVLLGRTSGYHTWLRPLVLAAGAIAALGLLAGFRLVARVQAAVAAVALVAVLAGPTAYSLSTVATAHTGSLPSAGPAGAGFGRGPGGGGFGGGRPGGFARGGVPGGGVPGGGVPGGAGFGGGRQAGNGVGQGWAPGGTQNGANKQAGGGRTDGWGDGGPGGGMGGPGGGPGGGMGGPGGGMGGLLNAAKVSDKMRTLLERDADRYTWIAAAVGSQSASGYQLATGDPVMPVGGFNGSDPSPTLEQFRRYVAEGKIHYFIGGGGFGMDGGRGAAGRSGGSNASSQIAAWVTSAFTSTTVDGVTIYDLTSKTPGGQ